MADIFVSCTSSDRDWAFWIAKELAALGHSPRVHEWEINRGDDIYAWMEQRHEAADHVLCVVSDDYLKAPYSTLERNAAIWQAAPQRPGFVLMWNDECRGLSRWAQSSHCVRRPAELFGCTQTLHERHYRAGELRIIAALMIVSPILLLLLAQQGSPVTLIDSSRTTGIVDHDVDAHQQHPCGQDNESPAGVKAAEQKDSC